MKEYHYEHPFELESGASLPGLTIAYDTYGTLNANADNVVWVCHALTANSDVADWWPHTVERGRFLDPEKYFIVCANFLGSHYGTTGPLHINPQTGSPWYNDFPPFTIRDMVQAHRLLAHHLGISQVELLVGSSIGGFQCIEWCVIDPTFARHTALIATAECVSPWVSAFNESQRMAIKADKTFGMPSPTAGAEGLAVARSIAMLSYRGEAAYNLTQTDSFFAGELFRRRVHSYQQHQGEKLKNRFNAYSYFRITQAMESHHVGRGRGGIEKALATILAKCLVVAISSDILFPPESHSVMVENIPNVEYKVIDSSFGHDGFLVESDKLDRIIQSFLNK
ncbi:homoserine O-acetyltransferase family protein [Prevotella ihumii]|uniref:homoserine O-acetyltransferase family protein n=1 Tax=Prevotella ihumii TaxID=1917878 RepID=UPI0009825437|nr:homoserine O-acetyltransferase [Prevotella ihumii]